MYDQVGSHLERGGGPPPHVSSICFMGVGAQALLVPHSSYTAVKRLSSCPRQPYSPLTEMLLTIKNYLSSWWLSSLQARGSRSRDLPSLSPTTWALGGTHSRGSTLRQVLSIQPDPSPLSSVTVAI